MKNIVVTRLNLQWSKKLTPNFVENSINRMKNINRRSLKNQSYQNFTLLTLTDETMTEFGEVLDNEIVLKIPSLNGSYNNDGIILAITNYVKSLKDETVIVTRLDSDDAIRFDFIENLRSNLKDKIYQYADTDTGFPCYDIREQKAYQSKIHSLDFTTQFVSFHETVQDFKCVPFLHLHTQIGHKYTGAKYENLKVLQFIHEENLSTKIYIDENGKKQEVFIDLSHYCKGYYA